MTNPERSTELLWRERPRRGLSLERIVRAAVELADADGLATLSMRRVAEGLGFTTMALYRHVPGRAELVALMRDEVLAEQVAATVEGAAEGDAGDKDGAGAGGAGVDNVGNAGVDDAGAAGAGDVDWRAALAAWARAGMDVHRRHPWLVDSADTRVVPGPNAVAVYEHALAVVERTGLPPAQVAAAVELVGGFVDSAARQVVAAERARQRTGIDDEEWWQDRTSLFEHLDGRYPALRRLYLAGAYDAPPDPFEFGLDRVLDGVEALIRDEIRDVTNGADIGAGTGRGTGMCAVCGRPVSTSPTGRPRAYCSRACQQRAYRTRRRGG